MTAVKSRERMNSLFQEMKLHYLTEPVPGLNSARDLTLAWPLGNAEVTLTIETETAIRLTVAAPERESFALDLTGATDSQIIETIIICRLTETKR